MSKFRSPEVLREQIVLWSQRLDDALPADHAARLIDELFRSHQFAPMMAEVGAEYESAEGQPAFHPRYLVLLYVYGVLHRIRSSRQLELACHNRIDVVWLMEGQKPDHCTIAGFVRRHRHALRLLLRATVRVGIDAGLVTMQHAAVDGSKVRANAGAGSVRTREGAAERERALEQQIEELEREFDGNERREGLLVTDAFAPDDRASADQRVQRLKTRRARLRLALETIDRRQRESVHETQPPKPLASTTDPESRVMSDKEGYCRPNYNVQLAVDAHAAMVVGVDLNDLASDQGQLTPMLNQIRDTCGGLPTEVSADSGYNSGRDLHEAEQTGVRLLVGRPPSWVKKDPESAGAALEAVGVVREGGTLSLAQFRVLPRSVRGDKLDRSAFAYDAATDTYRCPAGRTLRAHHAGRRPDGVMRTHYKTTGCVTCDHAADCCGNPARGREITRTEHEAVQERLRERMASPEAKAAFARRRETVEPRFGLIKSVFGLRQFLRRGKENTHAEWRLACAALNVGILIRQWSATRVALRAGRT